MAQVKRSRETLRDLSAIVRFIAEDNTSAAERWLAAIEELFTLMAAYPGMGEVVVTRRFGNVRRRSFGAYVIYFRERSYGVLILRVLHGARDQHKLL